MYQWKSYLCTGTAHFCVHLILTAFFSLVPLHIFFSNKDFSYPLSQPCFLWNGVGKKNFSHFFLIRQVKISQVNNCLTIIFWNRKWQGEKTERDFAFWKKSCFSKLNLSARDFLAFSFYAFPMQSCHFLYG